jgi:hypothetical protein
MRNGDYAPTRLVAQAEAANLLADLKTQHNMESQVGVLTMAGNRYDDATFSSSSFVSLIPVD